jgi:hypothetical protein
MVHFSFTAISFTKDDLDKDGNVVEEWISTKEPHIIERLKTKEVYIKRD